MRLEPGMRVRCVTPCNEHGCDIVAGAEFTVVSFMGDVTKVSGSKYWHDSAGFKPIVRVKAPSRPGCCNKACNGCPDFAFRARLHRFATSGANI